MRPIMLQAVVLFLPTLLGELDFRMPLNIVSRP